MSQTLDEFLKTRGFTDEQLDFFKNENIDDNSLRMMSEDELKKIIPKYGDRVAIVNFCKKMSTGRKQSLIEKIRSKLSDKDTKKDQGNKVASKRRKKQTRIIEIGWICNSKKNNELKYVRTQKGGGTRRLSVDGNLICTHVLEKALTLFFPNGKSAKGDINLFDYELLDYQRLKCDLHLTIHEMYEISALTTLRFYLSTIYKEDAISSDENELPSAAVRPMRSQRLSQTFNNFENLVKEAIEEDELESQIVELETTDTTISNSNELLNFLEEGLSDIEANLDQVIESGHSNGFLSSTQAVDNYILILHRGRVFSELIDCMKVHNIKNFLNIKIELILPNGKPERAEDVGGVLRDAISEFWETFYAKCTLGRSYKVPTLRHDFQEDEWINIGKICVAGYLAVGYFPIKIAPVFIKNCFENVISDDDILNNFFEYVSETEASLIKLALENFSDVDYDDIIEFCSAYDAKWIPKKDNFNKLILQIAKEELIQKPSYVRNCFSSSFQTIMDKINLEMMYDRLKPSVKNILLLFEIEENLDSKKNQTYNFLKKFIKNSEEKIRCSFLRFCTGSDLIVENKIKIDFIDTEGFQRSPIAHTCSGILEIPTSYEDYISFRDEFTNLLSSNIWVMDII